MKVEIELFRRAEFAKAVSVYEVSIDSRWPSVHRNEEPEEWFHRELRCPTEILGAILKFYNSLGNIKDPIT